MTWFAFNGYNNGKAVDIAGSQEKEAVAFGFHGYASEKQAESNPNSVAGFPNPFAIVQKSFVNLIIKDYQAALKEKAQPGGANSNILNPVTAAKAAIAGSPFGSIEDFLSQLTSPNLWIRVVKVAAGGAILIIGLLHITGADKAIGGFAAKAVRVAPLL